MAQSDKRPQSLRLAAGHQWNGRRSARRCRPARNGPGLGDVVNRFGGDEWGHKLDRCQWREVEPELEWFAPGWMDLGGCGRAIHVRGTRTLRRVPARHCGHAIRLVVKRTRKAYV